MSTSMAAMDEKKPSADESRRLVSEFFLKSLNVILGARIPSKYLHHQGSPSTSSSFSSKSFNLVLVNSPMRNKCHLSVVEPIVIDVWLLHHGSNACKDQVFQWDPSNPSQQQQSLLEQWIVHCVPWTCQLKDNVQSPEVTAGATATAPPPPPKSSKSKSSARKPPRPEGKTFQNPWKKVVKMLSVMLRSLYSLTRLLPAYKIFQQLNCSSSGSQGSPDCCHFDLSYKVRSSLGGGGGGGGLCKFDLSPVETDLGRMCISVRYSDAASVERAIQRTRSIFSLIIPNYVRGGGVGDDGSAAVASAASAGNPHFAVSDKRISAATRTMSSKIPAAKATAAAAAAATMRRSYSSPLDQAEPDKQQHQQRRQQEQELICPFAFDDEHKSSRDAAAAAVIAALQSAAPIERQKFRSTTLGDALRELKGYKDIATKRAVM